MTKTKSMMVFLLLIATVQFAGGGIVANNGAGATASEYFCCCAGECHCTADCCNHAPAGASNIDTPVVRIGAGSPILEAPRSCGTWTGTLSRSPESQKAFPKSQLRLFAEPPDGEIRHPIHLAPLNTSREALRPFAPRAPPCV